MSKNSEDMLDPRFLKIRLDPRFRPVPRKARKVKIDGRFSRMFTDKRFKTKYVVDKRGRRINQTSDDELRRFYALDDEEDKTDQEPEPPEITERRTQKRTKSNMEKSADQATKKKSRKETKLKKSNKSDKVGETSEIAESQTQDLPSPSNESESDDSTDESNYVDYARGEGLVSSSDEEDFELPLEPDEIIHDWGELDHDVPVSDNTSCRLAVCNMDWDRVTASDLLVLFNSFKPTGGVVESVKIYQSDFGAQRLANEDVKGPAELVEGDNDSTEGAGYSAEKLRQYQLNRLKYYYAVLDCDSSVTASSIYEMCDGMELELSASKMDLRFVPDEMEFDRKPVSEATGVPAAYNAPQFQTSALQQSKVNLTWDETDVARTKTTMRQISETEINEVDFTELLASTDEDEDEDEDIDDVNEDDDVTSTVSTKEKRAERYRALVESGTDDVDDRCELEITWQPGLQETTSERTVGQARRNTVDLTPWEQYLNRRKEKRMEQRKKHKNVAKPNESESTAPNINTTSGFDDPFFAEHLDSNFTTLSGSQAKKKRSKKTRSKLTEEEQRQQEELELLVTDGDSRKAHFSLKGILARENSKKKTKKKMKIQEQGPDDFQINLDDPRFEALFTTNEYAVDPSDPHFKKTKAMQAIVEEKQRKRSLNARHKMIPNSTTSVVSDNSHKVRRGRQSLSSLARSVKAKTEHYRAFKRQV